MKVQVVTASAYDHEAAGRSLEAKINTALGEIGLNAKIDISYQQSENNGCFYLTAFIQHASKF